MSTYICSNVSINQFVLEIIDFDLFWQEFRLRVEESARTAEEFTKLYYDSIDKKRHVSIYTHLPQNLRN